MPRLIPCVAALLCSGAAWAGPANPDPLEPPRKVSPQLAAVVRTHASSELSQAGVLESARAAFDGDGYPGFTTQWCAAAGRGNGEVVEITFSAPQPITSLQITAGDRKATLRAIEVTGDGGKVLVRPSARGVLEAPFVQRTRKLSFKLVDVDTSGGQPACIADVYVQGEKAKVVFLHDVTQQEADQLPAVVAAVDAAAATCDPKRFAELAQFPLPYDFIAANDGGAHAQHPDAASLAKRCRDRGIGRLVGAPRFITRGERGLVQVELDRRRHWVFAWRDGRWRLTETRGTTGGLE